MNKDFTSGILMIYVCRGKKLVLQQHFDTGIMLQKSTKRYIRKAYNQINSIQSSQMPNHTLQIHS